MNYNPSEPVVGAKVISDIGSVVVPAFGLYRYARHEGELPQ